MASDEPTSLETTRSIAPLFQRFPWGGKQLRNRIVMAPMTRSHSPGKVPGADVAVYYRRRAEGGTALLITEGTNPDHPAASGYPDVPGFYGREGLAGWKRVVDNVHEAGALIIPQLWHCGSIRTKGMEPDPTVPAYAPSAIHHPAHQDNGDVELPHAMTHSDIADTIASFVRSAVSARTLGFDGVELHGAHSYLIDQFFWDVTNQRTDRYGGSFENRLTFAVELISAVRTAVGEHFPIVFRFSQWKQGDYDCKLAKNPDQLGRFLHPLAEAGVDVFHASTHRFDEPEFKGSNLNLAGWAKELTGRPSITVGSVGLDLDFLRSYGGEHTQTTSLDPLIRRLERSEFDLVAVGRALLSDPAWAHKLQAGHEAEITPFNPSHLSRFE